MLNRGVYVSARVTCVPGSNVADLHSELMR